MENAGIFRGHLEYFTVIWYILLPFDNVVVIWNFFSRFGKLCQEKSGNPAVELATNVLNHTNAAKICMYIGCGKLFEIASRFQNVENIPNDLKTSPGGVAQLTSHPPEEQKTWVRIPPGYKVFLGSHSNAVVYNRLYMHCLGVKKRNKGIGQTLLVIKICPMTTKYTYWL
jgi:hypothetical protein